MLSAKTRRNLLVVLLALLALLIAFLLWWFLRSKPQPNPVVQPTAEETLPDAVRETIKEQRQKEAQQTRTNTASVQSASKTFAERYGSYSTEAEFANLRDVLPLMSASLAAETEAFIEGSIPAAEYYGVTTRVISLSVDASDETVGTAQVTVTTQREETKGTAQNASVRYQDLVLRFVREDGQWKVSSATWN